MKNETDNQANNKEGKNATIAITVTVINTETKVFQFVYYIYIVFCYYNLPSMRGHSYYLVTWPDAEGGHVG